MSSLHRGRGLVVPNSKAWEWSPWEQPKLPIFFQWEFRVQAPFLKCITLEESQTPGWRILVPNWTSGCPVTLAIEPSTSCSQGSSTTRSRLAWWQFPTWCPKCTYWGGDLFGLETKTPFQALKFHYNGQAPGREQACTYTTGRYLVAAFQCSRKQNGAPKWNSAEKILLRFLK